ncbi:hypothetical protein [Tuwongella immobilis]|uniref:Uncharacterized protein n=1 Tax=Tuwongella immobilis TaxID=692036 RepID=A0A6C2YT70_9BACT|nr:hypothetical protein [Tuwongella immobilis]VIP04527.1 unnamed protein product [Tuwongella immobilis]VTS06415.1 unnamed protein product [Tuwongella immobilis]
MALTNRSISMLNRLQNNSLKAAVLVERIDRVIAASEHTLPVSPLTITDPRPPFGYFDGYQPQQIQDGPPPHGTACHPTHPLIAAVNSPASPPDLAMMAMKPGWQKRMANWVPSLSWQSSKKIIVGVSRQGFGERGHEAREGQVPKGRW